VDGTPTFARFDMPAPTVISLLDSADPDKSYGWLQWTGDQWRGKVYVVNPTHKECRDKGYMQPAAAKTSADHTRVEGEWRGRSIGDDCKLTDQPGNGALKWDRFVGTTFVPIRQGKFIYTLSTRAVGPNRAQYKAMVKLGWDFKPVAAKKVRLVYGATVESKWDINSPAFDPSKLTKEEQAQVEDAAFVAGLKAKLQRTTQNYEAPTGEFEFTTDKPGPYQFDVEVLDADGNVLHSDHADVVIPTDRELLGR
jgi:hypothetical protein